MYKVGDEVLVKGEIVSVDEEVPYPVEVRVCACSLPLCFTEEELKLATKTYEQGLADAWELAKKIYDMKCDAIEEIFGVKGGFYEVIRNFTFEDCRDKIESYEKEKEIKVGDVVTTGEFSCVITRIYNRTADVIFADGVNGTVEVTKVKKTGNHIDIESLLKQIGE